MALCPNLTIGLPFLHVFLLNKLQIILYYFLTKLSITNQETIRAPNTFKAIQWMSIHGIRTDGPPDRFYEFVHTGSTLPIESVKIV